LTGGKKKTLVQRLKEGFKTMVGHQVAEVNFVKEKA